MNSLRRFLLSLGMIIISAYSISAQENPEPEMVFPPEHLLREQFHAIIRKDTAETIRYYHKDVELYQYPGTLLAKGKENAETFWSLKFAKKSEVVYEIRLSIEVGDKLVTQVRMMSPESPEFKEMVVIMEMKNQKIFRLFFTEPIN